MCLSGPTTIFGAAVVVPLCTSCAATVVVAGPVVPVCPVVLVPVAGVVLGAVLVAVLSFFFVLAVGVVCAVANDPATRKALIQKLAANFKYFLIGVISRICFVFSKLLMRLCSGLAAANPVFLDRHLIRSRFRRVDRNLTGLDIGCGCRCRSHTILILHPCEMLLLRGLRRMG